MIKGPMAVQLMEFSNYAGFVLAKGSLKDLVKRDVEPLVDTTINILETALKEPSFTKETATILWEIGSAKAIKNDLIKKGKDVIKGNDKKVILGKAYSWYNLVQNLFGNCLFSTLSEDAAQKLFPSEIGNQIGKESEDGIQDGISCLIYSLPTPAAMIFFRVAEKELRNYVSKIGDEPCYQWYKNLEKLQNNITANKSIVKDFDWLKDKRNEAEHPDKRYTQEEAEEILHRLSGLLMSIYKKGKEN